MIDGRGLHTPEFGAPVDPRNLLRVVEVAAEAAGVKGVGAHTLCISRRPPICSGTAPSRSPATCTATPATTPPDPQLTAALAGSGYDTAIRCAACRTGLPYRLLYTPPGRYRLG
jgi:hypothetical protein